MQYTFHIIVIGEIGAILRTRGERRPESAANFAFFETGQVDLAVHATLFKLLGEILVIYVILIQKPYRDSKVIVAI